MKFRRLLFRSESYSVSTRSEHSPLVINPALLQPHEPSGSIQAQQPLPISCSPLLNRTITGSRPLISRRFDINQSDECQRGIAYDGGLLGARGSTLQLIASSV